MIGLLGLLRIQAANLGELGIFLSQDRIDQIKQRIQAEQEPTYQAYLQLEQDAIAAAAGKPRPPTIWYVPGYYSDPDGHQAAKLALHDDANSVYALALMYKLTGNDEFAEEAARYIDAWVETVEEMRTHDDSRLSFSYHFPPFIFAADLIEDNTHIWPEAEQQAFRDFVRNKALPMNTMHVANNWGNWGGVLVFASAVYLQDEDLFDEAVARWKALTRDQIADDGHLRHEVRRQTLGDRGIWYSHFSLMPQTISAEIARLQGLDLFNWKSPEGRCLELAYETLVPWTVDPSTFPYYTGTSGQKLTDYISYWEILNMHWPNDLAAGMIEEMRPLTADHSAPYLTLTHGSLPPTRPENLFGPEIQRLHDLDNTTIQIVFSEPMSPTEASNPSNYRIINQGRRIRVTEASLSSDGTTVELTLAASPSGNIVVDVSSNLTDFSGDPLPTPSTRITTRGASTKDLEILIDFGANASSTTKETWNRLSLDPSTRDAVGNGSGTPHQYSNDLLDSGGNSTGIGLTMTDAMTGIGSHGTTTGPFPSGSTSDYMLGSTVPSWGFIDNQKGVFVFSNLDPGKSYDFTFFASRAGVTDNRETKYELTGASTHSTLLDAANNTSSIASINGVVPSASGAITLTVSPGSRNNNPDKAYYLNFMKIASQGAPPQIYPPVPLESGFVVDWSGSGTLVTTDDLSGNWYPIDLTPSDPEVVAPSAPYIDTAPYSGKRFYRLGSPSVAAWRPGYPYRLWYDAGNFESDPTRYQNITIATGGGSGDAAKITEQYGVTYLNRISGSNLSDSNILDPSVEDDYWTSQVSRAERIDGSSSQLPFDFVAAGVAMDEWVANSSDPEAYDWIQTGLRAGKSLNPEVFVANWLSYLGADQLYDMTEGGTIDLNMLQGYELTIQEDNGVDWSEGIAHLEEFQQRGLIRKVVYGMGYITDQAGWNGFEWTENRLRSRMDELKRKFPDMPGIAFHASPAGNQSDQDALISLVDQLSGEYWPDLPIPDGLYSMTPQVDTRQRIDVSDGGSSNGTPVITWRGKYPDVSANQLWRFTHLGDSVYKIQPVHASHLALDVDGAANSNGAKVQLWADNGSVAQQWQLSKVVGGYQLRPLCSPDKYLTFANTANDTQAEIWTQLTNDKQVFALAPEVLPNDHVPPYYQLEAALLSGGSTTSSTHLGSMGGYINMPAWGGSARLNDVDGGSGGLRALCIRYASGFPDTRSINLTVNGNVHTLSLLPTGSWQNWENRSLNAHLNAGTNNTIILASTGSNPPAMDKLTIDLPVYQCEDATLSGGAFISSSNPGSDGQSVGMPANGAALTWRNIEGGSGGAKGLKIRYINGFDDDRVVNLTVNGATTQVTFPPTGDWSTWHELTVFRTLNASATNRIAIGSAGSNTPGFDRMIIGIAP
ncbi:alginate lyase family protein [Cerasicoccus fimbriatus]|uniref:alginate lyase family protein n=1 Tax=Cerasicoccus fimbriatus TaxID=3014554 RepID=UPI0022B51580|nr:alginate lyase family protein [Cerasicoccus sp. TK19100]